MLANQSASILDISTISTAPPTPASKWPNRITAKDDASAATVTARNHDNHGAAHQRLVAEAAAEKPAGQRDRDAGQDEPAHQQPDLGVPDSEIADQERRDRGRGLELVTEGKSGREQHPKDEPAAFEHEVPLAMRRDTRTVAFQQREGEDSAPALG